MSCIRPYHSPVAGQSIIPPEPVTIEGTPEYEVEEVWIHDLSMESSSFWSSGPVTLMTTTPGNQKPTVQTLMISLRNSTSQTPLPPENSVHKTLLDLYFVHTII